LFEEQVSLVFLRLFCIYLFGESMRNTQIISTSLHHETNWFDASSQCILL